MVTRGTSPVVALAALLIASPACWATTLAPMVPFATEAELGDNFTTTANSNYYVADDDGGYGPGGYVANYYAGSHNNVVYDANKHPGGGIFGQATIDVDFRAATAADGLGIWCLGNGGTDRSYKDWVFFQVDASGTTDNVRFFAGRSMATNSGGSSQNGDGYNADTTLGLNKWMHLRLDIDNSAGTSANATLSIYDSQTLFDSSTRKLQTSWTYTAGGFASSEVGLSLYSGNFGSANFDNFAVYDLGTAPTNLVPEPSTLTLMAVGIAGLLAYAWRKRN